MGYTSVVPGTVEAKAGKVKEPGNMGAWSTHEDPTPENKTIKQFTDNLCLFCDLSLDYAHIP